MTAMALTLIETPKQTGKYVHSQTCGLYQGGICRFHFMTIIQTLNPNPVHTGTGKKIVGPCKTWWGKQNLKPEGMKGFDP